MGCSADYHKSLYKCLQLFSALKMMIINLFGFSESDLDKWTSNFARNLEKFQLKSEGIRESAVSTFR